MKSSKFKRGLKLLGTAAQMVQSEAVQAAKRVVNPDDENSKLNTRILQATKLVQQLASLKGAAMKLGQILALEARDYFPDEVVRVLEQLQSSAEPMKQEIVERILREELGEKTKKFEKFDFTPIAAASIGQVHQAWASGQHLAVKVQYPDIGEAMQSDVFLLQQLVKVISVVAGKPGLDSKGIIEEVTSMFHQEIDYQLEAAYLEEYRTNAAAMREIWVPRVITDLSTKRVLTTEFAEGVSLSEALRTRKLTAAQRDFYADLFMQVYVREFCDWGLVQSDPNLGNFLIDPSASRLTLLDFGATKRFTPEFRTRYCRLVVAAFEEKRSELLSSFQDLGFLDEREKKDAQDALADLVLESMSPFRSKIHDFSDNAYPARMRELTLKAIAALKYSPPPRDLIFLHRKLGGIFQILRRLEAKRSLAPYLAVYRARL